MLRGVHLEGLFRRRRLPHWDVPGATYFVTACLHNCLPARRRKDLERLRRDLDRRPRPPALSEEAWEDRKDILVFKAMDQYLDTEPAVNWLRHPAVAEEVRKSVYHFAGARYDVFEYVIMPSHLHWVFRPTLEYEASLKDGERTPRERIMHSMKLWTSRVCNGLLNRRGHYFWQQESYDRWIRDDRETYWITQYVQDNPVRAGLATQPDEWQWSSAYDRRLWGVAEGLPITPPPPRSAP